MIVCHPDNIEVLRRRLAANGRGDKKAVQAGVMARLNLDGVPPEDAADAIAVALAGIALENVEINRREMQDRIEQETKQ